MPEIVRLLTFMEERKSSLLWMDGQKNFVMDGQKKKLCDGLTEERNLLWINRWKNFVVDGDRDRFFSCARENDLKWKAFFW